MFSDYYTVDTEAKFINRELLLQILADKIKVEKHFVRFTELIDLAIAEQIDLSEDNVSRCVLLAKKEELGIELASAIAEGKNHEHLVDKYKEICSLTNLEQLLEKGLEIYGAETFDELFRESLDLGRILRVYPRPLADRLNGGLRPGEKLTLFARPETGKTAECTTLAGGFAREGHLGTYFTNEDRPGAILLRLTSCLTGLTANQIRDNPQQARDMAVESGLERITVVSVAPGTPRQIEDVIVKTEPEWIIVDQLRNLEMKAESRVNQLEAAATFTRNMAKKYDIVVIDVTQAGDSASGKAVLEMGDVDFSNTGIPAQADVMLGIGMTNDMMDTDTRVFSLCKNKITGDHGNFPVKLNRYLSRYTAT